MRTKITPFLILLLSLILAAILGGIFLIANLHTPIWDEVAAAVTQTSLVTELPVQSVQPQPVIPSDPIPTGNPEPSPLPEVQTVSAIDFFRNNITPERYAAWIRKLSGVEPVQIGGQEYTIETRYSYAMFTGQENAKATEFLLETLRQWVPESQITLEPYTYTDATSANTWFNIIVTFPGETLPDEQILFSAHYDSCVVFEGNPMVYAPGANDNGTGVATILEAVRIFSQIKFDRTVKVIFFSGEENFQQGSKAYVEKHAGENIIGLINMDMYGTDKDNDRCFELYVGELESSRKLADSFIQTINENNLNLSYDYLTKNAYALADQAPFWEGNIPAITAMENFLTDSSEGGCVGQDRTDFWHLPGDQFDTINLTYAYDIGLAGTFTVLNLAGAHPMPATE